jgi:hypothetical protein
MIGLLCTSVYEPPILYIKEARAQALTGVPDNCDQGVPPRTTRFILNLMIVCSTMMNVDLFREIVPGTAFLFGLVYVYTGHCGDQGRAKAEIPDRDPEGPRRWRIAYPSTFGSALLPPSATRLSTSQWHGCGAHQQPHATPFM